LGTVALLLAPPAAAQDFDAAYKEYREGVKRPSLNKRTRARERLARTGDPRALDALIKDYARPEDPKDQVRYLIAFIAAEQFWEPPFFAKFDEWCEKNDKPADAWLWYQALRNRLQGGDPAHLMDLARGNRSVFLRSAAVEALRFAGDEQDLLPFIAEMERKLPAGGLDRAVLLESLTALLCSRRELVKAPEFREPAEALMRRMDEPATLDRTRIAMGRQFAKLFKTRFVWRDGPRWQQELDFVVRGGKQPAGERYAPTFAGIEATGDRICYVIDLSDSMLEPMTPRELEKLPRGPTTGFAAAQRRKEAKSERWKRAFEQVKWDNVKNRFDAAREMLKASLVMLEEDQYFCIICFGSGADVLKSTRGLQKATLDKIQAAMRELDGIRPGPKADNRPHGTLMGNTNMHGGLHRAFKLRGGGMVGPAEYVNGSTFDDGCDTIFLLSDGAPTWDDWPASDRADPDDQAGDPELGGRQADSDTLNFPGPYARTHHLISDVTRLNLFRKVEIHCVGMGGAQMNTLRTLAALGRGEAVDLTAGQ